MKYLGKLNFIGIYYLKYFFGVINGATSKIELNQTKTPTSSRKKDNNRRGSATTANSIKVYCRFRPLSEEYEDKIQVEFPNNETLNIQNKDKRMQYKFDQIYNGDETQSDVYEKSANKNLVMVK